MTQIHSQRSRRRPAQSMVEFALIMPVLFLFILGIIEMGYALFVYTSVQNAAREGARAAAVKPCPSSSDTAAIQTATRSRLPALVDLNTITPAIAYSNSANADFGTAVTVTVDYSFTLIDPLVQSFIPMVRVHAVASRSITTGCSSAVVVVPTLTPTSTSTATTTPTSTPTNTPVASTNTPVAATSTPTITPTLAPPTATPCTRAVPNLFNMSTNGNPNAQAAWTAAGFTGAVVKGNNGNFTIKSQSLAAGSMQPCNASITVFDH